MKLGGSLRRTRRTKSGGGIRWTGRPFRTGSPGDGTDAWILTGWHVAAAVLGLFGGYLVATRIVFPAPPPPDDLVVVPDVRGADVAGGEEALSDLGLDVVATDSLHHPTAPVGVVLGQSPLPGQMALPGSSVRVTTSLGPQLRRVPDVARVDANRARIVLETSGFLVSMDSVEAELPRGRVVETRPGPDSTLALPAEVHLMVSLGPPLVAMPDVLGLEESEARAVLESLGLVISEVREVFRFGRDQGIVVEQDPPSETPLERGSAVLLAVGRRGG
ncbi:MAG: PASTA domain-containing protein [Gemmatimonadota bacterium]|jgi:beta-lactam-binding protein with PASTA domain